jgi:hypothetical protein
MKVIAVAAAVLALGGLAGAQGASPAPAAAVSEGHEPSARQLALARDLITENGGLAAFHALIERMTSPEAGEDAQATVAKAEARAEMRRKLEAIVPEVADAFSAVYAHAYSEDQLAEMVAYAKSPAGRAVQAKRPRMVEAMGPESVWAMRAIAADSDADMPPPPALPGPKPTAASLALAAQIVTLSHAAESEADGPFKVNRLLGAVVAAAAPGELFQPRADDTSAMQRMKARARALVPQFADRLAWIVASVYTDEEMAAQIAYMRSPTGQAGLRLKPKVDAEMQAAVVGIVKRTLSSDGKPV